MRYVGYALLGLLALLVVPVVVTALLPTETRHLEGIRLAALDYREVSFPNSHQDLDLAGLLFVPEGPGPFPAAVIIRGSGASRRDNGWYLTLVSHLQANGIAVLLPDKRGSGASGGDWRSASFEDLATDTLAAVDFLRQTEPVAIAGIGIIGMSQGGHIAPLAARRDGGLDFVINVVGGAVPMHEQLVFEETHNLRELGVLPGMAELLARPAAASLIHLRQKSFWDAVGNFDPLPWWREVRTPSLVLYGAQDTNVSSRESARLLRALDNPRIRVKVYPGSGHALETPAGHGRSIIRDEALAQVRDFILAATSTPTAATDQTLGPQAARGERRPSAGERDRQRSERAAPGMETDMNHHEVIEHYYRAYRERDLDSLRSILVPDFHFVSAFGEYHDRDAMLEEIWPAVGRAWATQLRIFGEGPEYVVLYEHELAPGVEQPPMTMAEHIRFDGDRIAAIEVFTGRALDERAPSP